MGRLLLIRHGQASFGAADYDRLSALGEEQSRLLGRWLGDTGMAPDLVVSGTLLRHRRTADLCLETAGAVAPREVMPGLDEIDHTEILARSRPDLADDAAMRTELLAHADPHRAFQRMFESAVARWVAADTQDEYAMPWPVFRQRALDALNELIARTERNIWVFTSGGPIAVIAHSLLGGPLEQTFVLAWPLINSGMTTLRTSAGKATLYTYNAAPHLDRTGDASLTTFR
jgi:broad specificity phosphatase PhoE